MAEVKPIKWRNILAHVAFSVPWAAFGGAMFQLGFYYGYPAVFPFFLLGGLILLSDGLYWMVRELYQHDKEFGGKQSNLEWVIPALSVLPGGILGWFISRIFL